SVISEVSDKIDRTLLLPSGYYVTYGGQFQNLEAAKARLSVAVPVALSLIFILLYFTFGSVKQTLLIYTAVPMAAIGGIFALWIRGMNFSISAGVGFIALFGVAVLNGIVLISEFNRLEKEGVTDITERVYRGLQTRLRPVLMTAMVASLGFLPMALSVSPGAEVQKPLATVVIGGLLTSTILTLVVLPIFYIVFSRRRSGPARNRIGNSKPPVTAVLILGIIFFPAIAGGQTRTFTLEESVKMAMENNLEVRSSALSVNEQKALQGASWDIGKTEFNLEYGQINSYLKDNNLSVSQSVSFPTVYLNQRRLATERIKSSEWQLKGSMLDIATQVKQSYWQLVYLYSKERLLEYQDSLYTMFMKAAELRAKSGETNKLEMITARSQSLEIKNMRHQAGLDIAIVSRNIKTLLNTSFGFYPADTVLKRAGSLALFDSSAIASNPALGFLRQEIEVSRRQKELERSRIMPDISVGYFSQTIRGNQEIDGVQRTFGTGDRFTGIQAGIAIPVWIMPSLAKARAARINEDINRTRTENYYKSLTGRYQSLLDEYSKYSSGVDYYENQAVPEADIIIGQSAKAYKAGAMDYLDYVISLGRALDIKQKYLDVLNNFNQTIINIEYITGKTY
ncbi:MAG: efflux RND transporter permease subunit, partial [Bacteroidales bacterium]